MIAYKLNKPLDAQKFIKDIDKLIHKSNISQNSLLLVKIINISYDNDCAIPKLENKNLDH